MPDMQPSLQVPRLPREGAEGEHQAEDKHLQAEVHSSQGVLQTPETKRTTPPSQTTSGT